MDPTGIVAELHTLRMHSSASNSMSTQNKFRFESRTDSLTTITLSKISPSIATQSPSEHRL
jgi:hypothetical protein